jgi:hypothetical protein
MDSTGTGLSDTSPEISTQVIERWRGMSATAKLNVVDELDRACTAMATAGVRRRHPHADDEEVHLRVLALTVPRELMVGAYGWDPQIEGYRPWVHSTTSSRSDAFSTRAPTYGWDRRRTKCSASCPGI